MLPSAPQYENPIVVGALTFVGVLLTIWFAHRRMRAELHAASERANNDQRHDANQAHQERITTARRAAYLDAAAEVVRVQSYIGKLPDCDPSDLKLEEVNKGLLEAAAKISILGEMETVLKCRKLVSAINRSMVRGVTLALPLQSKKLAIAAQGRRYQESMQEQKRILAAMKSHNEGHSRNEAIFNRLNNEFDLQRAVALECRSKIDQLHVERQAGQRAYMTAMLRETQHIGELSDELVHLVRDELGLATSPKLLVQSSKVAFPRSNGHFQLGAF